jgi:hypothetical protein
VKHHASHGLVRSNRGSLSPNDHLAVEQGGRYRSVHPVIAQAVRDDMTSARRREVHRALAQAITAAAAAGDEVADPVEVAHHAALGRT